MQLIVLLLGLLFGGAIATTSALGLAALSSTAKFSSTGSDVIASCVPRRPGEGSSSSQEPSPTPTPSPAPRQS